MLGDQAAAKTAYAQVVQEGRKIDRLTLALFYATKNLAPEEALRLIEAERQVRGGPYVEDTYAWVLYRAGRLTEAQQASTRALALGTQDARLLYHAGAIRLATGDKTGRQFVQQALAHNPMFDWTGAREAKTLLNTAHTQTATHAALQ
jgi:tetratricopeptide (TPR) repeat protein